MIIRASQDSACWKMRSARARFSFGRHHLFGRATIGALAVLFLFSVFLVPSHGATINYGDFVGDTVTFIDVTEGSSKPLPLYGAPTLSGDSLAFSPQQFDAESANQIPPQDITDGQLSMMVVSNAGLPIQTIGFKEGGALSVAGFVGGATPNTDDTYVDVTATGFVTVLEVNGAAIPGGPLAIPINLVFNFGVGGNGAWRFASEGAVVGFLWEGEHFVNLNDALMAAGRPKGATKINVNLDNILLAQSEPLGRARIDKKLFLEITTTIPEPTSLMLVCIGLIGLAAGRRSSR